MLDGESSKVIALEEDNRGLKKTLSETQGELESLLKQYERLRAQFIESERECGMAKRKVEGLETEVNEKGQLLKVLKEKEERAAKELEEVYGALSENKKVTKECESKLQRRLREAIGDNEQLKKRLEMKEKELAEIKTVKEAVDRIGYDKGEEAKRARREYEALRKEKERIEGEWQREKEQTAYSNTANKRSLSVKLNETERRELEAQGRMRAMEGELKEVKERLREAEGELRDKKDQE